MSRYIDADELVAWCQRTSKAQSTVTGKAYVNALLTAVDCCSTADVAPVRHGEWLMPLTDEPWRIGYFCRCSVCKKINNGHTLKTPCFCENCGAKMDG